MNDETIGPAVPARTREPVWLEPREQAAAVLIALVLAVLSLSLLVGLLEVLAWVTDLFIGAPAYD